MVHLLATCGQLGLAAPVDDDRLGTQTLGRAYGVHGDVAAAHHNGTPAHEDGRVRTLRIVCPHEVHAREELVGREYAVEVLSLDAHEARQACARADEYGVVALPVEKVVDRQRAAYDYVGLELDAQTACRLASQRALAAPHVSDQKQQHSLSVKTG